MDFVCRKKAQKPQEGRSMCVILFVISVHFCGKNVYDGIMIRGIGLRPSMVGLVNGQWFRTMKRIKFLFRECYFGLAVIGMQLCLSLF